MALAVAFSFLAAIGFSTGYVLIRIAVQHVSAPTATFFNVFTGAVLVLALALALDFGEVKALPPVAFAWFALMGIMAYPLARVLVNTAITMVGAARAAPANSLQPVIALALAIPILGERPNLIILAGTPMVVIGLILVVMSSGGNEAALRVVRINKLGYLLAIAAAAIFASRDVISRHVVAGIAPPLVTAGFALAIGGSVLLALIHRDVVSSLRRVPLRYIAICGLAGVCQGLAVTFLFQALSRAPVTVVSPINASSPLITLLLTHLFLRRLESINPLLVLGACLGVAGVVTVVLGTAAG